MTEKALRVFIIAVVLLLGSASGYCQDPLSKPSSPPQSEAALPLGDSSAVSGELGDKREPSKAAKKDSLILYQKAVASARDRIHGVEGTLELAEKRDWPPSLRSLAGQNVEMAQEILEMDDKVQRVKANIAQLKERQTQVKASYSKNRERVASMGLTPSVAALLQKQRRGLVKLELPRRSAVRRRAEIRRVNEEELHLQDLEEQIDKLDSKNRDERLAAMKLDPGEERIIRGEAEKMLQEVRVLIDDLRVVNSYYLALLGDESYAERALRTETEGFIGFINASILWTRGNQTFGLADVAFLDTAGLRFLNTQNWTWLGEDIVRSMKREWLWWGLILLISVGWFVSWPKRLKFIETLNYKVERIKADSIVPTLTILGVVILSAGVIPLLISFAGHLLWGVPGCHEFTRSISLGLCTFAGIFFFARLARETLRPGGLGEVHFSWSQPVCHSVRRFALWTIVLIAPLMFLLTVINTGLSTPVRGSLGRVLFMLEMVILAVILVPLFRARSPIFAHDAHREKQGVLVKTRKIWLLLSVIVPLSILTIVFMGYYRSGVSFGNDLILTIVLIGALIFLSAFLFRWDRIARYRPRLEEEGESGEPSGPEGKDAGVETINKHTAILIRLVIAILGLAGLYWIWSDNMPVMEFLNRFVLWTYLVGVEMKATTLGNLILCFLIIGFTILIAKNLSGFLKTVIFNRVKMTSGNQHALTLIIQYAVVILGLTLALNSIGIGWSKFQWLLAALTVGLGFGLQDIVANFASGLIILFERPISIGDTITINGVSGQVTKMRIRATTVTDWDKKEVIIPNKSFLTSDIVNWSLSNQLNRVVIPVGVAYGSDAKKTEELLLKIARGNPLILDDPSSSVIFNNFGDNSLDFNLRVFVHNKDRMTVIHQLHLAINDAFNQEGIEIPFPQRDTHLDTLKPFDVRIVKKDSDSPEKE